MAQPSKGAKETVGQVSSFLASHILTLANVPSAHVCKPQSGVAGDEGEGRAQ